MKKREIIIFENVKGKIYNYLTVLAEAAPFITKASYKSRRWLFKCLCGKEKVINPSNVLNGSVKSCGCKRKFLIKKAVADYYKKEYVLPVEGRLYANYKSQAKKHSKEFKLSKEDFKTLVNSDCYYCGEIPFLVRGNKTMSMTKPLNGIDRLDSSKGYVKDNVVSCCIICNRAKNTLSVEKFKNWLTKIYNNFINEKFNT